MERTEVAQDWQVICASRTVFNHVQGKVDLVFDDLGEQEVKNIPKAVQIFKVLLGSPAPFPR